MTIMNSYKKKFLKNAIIIPIVIAVVMTILFFVSYNAVADNLIYKQGRISLSDYSYSELSEAEEIMSENGSVNKSDIMSVKDNTVIATADFDGQAMPVVYKANEVNSSGNLSLNGDIFFGEAGVCCLYCNRKDNKNIRMLSENDTINIDSFYGDYSYRVVQVTACENEAQLGRVADSMSKALVLYTDSNTSIGINNSYCVVVCEMIDGIDVTQ